MLPKCSVLLLVICCCCEITQGKTIDSAKNIKNRINDISTDIANNIRNSTLTIYYQREDIIEKAINTAKNFTNRISEISTDFVNNIRNSNSTIPFVPDYIIEALSTWPWIVLGIICLVIIMALVLCCCPGILCEILCCPIRCAGTIISTFINVIKSLISTILSPLRCCFVNCIGFSKVGPRASSLASGFQSRYYGGYTPSGSCFSNLQSYGMRQNYGGC